MRNQLVYVIMLLAAQHTLCHSQVAQSLNAPRDGDCLVGYELHSGNIEGKGKDVTWNLSQATLGEKKHKKWWECVCDNPDSICYTECSTMHYIKPTKEGLASIGFENNQMKVSLETPISYLLFPMDYADGKEGTFAGYGSYCDKVRMDVSGRYVLTADATGQIVLPETGDTLRNVIRVSRSIKVMTRCLPTNDFSAVTYEERRWYARGCRYPVIESSATRTSDGKEIAEATFFYPPSEQYDIAYDYDNEKEREAMKANASARGTDSKDHGNNFDYHIANDESAHKATIHFTSDTDMSVRIILADVCGIAMKVITKDIGKDGDVSFEYGDLRHGQYTLYIEACGNKYSETFTVR